MKKLLTYFAVLFLVSGLSFSFGAGCVESQGLCGESSNPKGELCCENFVCVEALYGLSAGTYRCQQDTNLPNCPPGNCHIAQQGSLCPTGSVVDNSYSCTTGSCCMPAPVLPSCPPGNCHIAQQGSLCPTGSVRDDSYSCTTGSCCMPGGDIQDVPYSGPFFSSFTQVITPIVKILFYGGLLIGVAFIVYSGYIIMTSEGSPDRVQQGKEHLTASILGTMFILLSAAILRVIINLIS